MASVMRLRPGLFALATSTFPEQHISERGKKRTENLTATAKAVGGETEALAENNKSEEQNN